MPAAAATASKAKTPTNRLSQATNAGYRFREKDPDLDFVNGVIVASGKTPEWIEKETAKMGHKVSAGCIVGWLYKGVRRPQNYTMTIVMEALGYERHWIERNSKRNEA
jgi:hypothetical protein